MAPEDEDRFLSPWLEMEPGVGVSSISICASARRFQPGCGGEWAICKRNFRFTRSISET